MIKSAIDPDETADRGIHLFTYSLYPHSGTFKESDVQLKAMNLNLPVLTYTIKGRNVEDEFVQFSLVEIESEEDHVLIDTIKAAEDGQGWIVRIYEYKNKKENNVKIHFHQPVLKVCECNLCEENEVEVQVKDDIIAMDIGCYEIKTFKIYC